MSDPLYDLGEIGPAVEKKLRDLDGKQFSRRFWSKDPTLWNGDSARQKVIRNALGWLHVPGRQLHDLPLLREVVSSVRSGEWTRVLLMGMGGSSLCPEVCRLTFGKVKGYPELDVLDSTVPSQVRRLERRVDLEKTLFVVSSKSGTTTEALAFFRYFFERVRKAKGERAGKSFLAITDPGSYLEKVAAENGFRGILPGVPDIGGRYSALSNFGIVPAALMGVDVEQLLLLAERMRQRCGPEVSAGENPGIRLGVGLGELARRGRDKLTLVTSPGIQGLGLWLEQLIAESTGKAGKGIIPVDGETIGPPEIYGEDRVFAYIRESQRFDEGQDAAVLNLQRAGHPVIRMELADRVNLGEAFFLWEMATAVSGFLLEINPFDQPNVQESKDNTKSLLKDFQERGSFRIGEPLLSHKGIELYAEDPNRPILQGGKTLEEVLGLHLSRIQPGDYFAMNVFLEQNDSHHEVLQRIRHRVRDGKRVATTLGYGPRFLHSTGQIHKGGKNSGLFIQITSDDGDDLPIPGETYSFGILNAAQSLGDFQSLNLRKRRVVRLHLGSNVVGGLKKLEEVIDDLF